MLHSSENIFFFIVSNSVKIYLFVCLTHFLSAKEMYTSTYLINESYAFSLFIFIYFFREMSKIIFEHILRIVRP